VSEENVASSIQEFVAGITVNSRDSCRSDKGKAEIGEEHRPDINA
jgi:hypothetical protein